MNKLEKLIEEGFKVKIQSSSKFCLTLDDVTPCMSFNSDSIEEAIDAAYGFAQEQKKVADKTELEKQITEIIIDVPQSQEIKIDEELLSVEYKVTTTIRLYSDICERFKDFAETYKEYKSMDLISMALLEYIEKYKK
ncbi:MAG: hypothetical protein ACI8WT_000639 [Clostridium sp.]|jgi:hypothetical protein